MTPEALGATMIDVVFESGRGDTTRTCDLMVPNHPLYLAELRPDVITCRAMHIFKFLARAQNFRRLA